LFSYVDLEDRVPGHHPLRAIRSLVNEVRWNLRLYADTGRHSIPPERLLTSAAAAGVLHDPLGTSADAILDHYAWRHHCRGLFQMPIAA
jgi:hypothetical protein